MRSYIVDSALLAFSPPIGAIEWHATPIPADPTKSLLVVRWDNPNAEIDYESRADVVFLGDPWDQMPPDAGALLSSLQDPPVAPTGAVTASLPATDPPTPPPAETVSASLRRVSWGGARFVR